MDCKVTDPLPLAKLSARAVDPNNVGVQGIVFDLYRQDGGAWLFWRSSTSGSDGNGEFGASDGGVIAGAYMVRVRFVTDHQLAVGESNDRPVIMSEGDEILLIFRVVPKDTQHELTQIAVPHGSIG